MFVTTAYDVLIVWVHCDLPEYARRGPDHHEIGRLRAAVSALASDPDNTAGWYQNIEAIDWESPRPVAVGSRLRFAAKFLGRALKYTCEVTEMVPGERFVMRTTRGPFPMQTTYTWEDTATGALG